MNTTTMWTNAVGIRQPPPDPARSGQLVQRMRAEYIEMPGLMLTLRQAARMWCETAERTEAALTELVERGFLVRDVHGAYRRRGACPRCS
jgi:hypothetical protein